MSTSHVTNVKLLRATGFTVVFNNYEFNEFEAEVADMKINVLLSIYDKVEEGDCLAVSDMHLTHYADGEARVFAFRIVKYEVIPAEEYVCAKHVDIVVVGKLVKTKNARLRQVTARGLDFIACTLSVRNEEDVPANVLLAAFRDMAVKVNELDTDSIVRVDGRFRELLHEEGYELNVTNLEFLREAGKKDKKGRK